MFSCILWAVLYFEAAVYLQHFCEAISAPITAVCVAKELPILTSSILSIPYKSVSCYT